MTDTLIQPPIHGGARKRVALLGMGTAVPPSVDQKELAAMSDELACSNSGQSAWLRRVFMKSGVEQRGSVLRVLDGPAQSLREFYQAPAIAGEQGPSTGTRMQRYQVEAPPLLERAARAALDKAALSPDQITHIITVSCTGFFAPGLDFEMITRLGLRRNIRRTHIGFMGCHAAFNALATAQDAVRADPNALVLVCCVELSTLHFAYGWNPEKLVANALFADGAAACVVGASEAVGGEAGASDLAERAVPPWQLLDTASLLLPDCRPAMTWQIADHGFEMTLSAELPALITQHVRPWCEFWLAQRGLAIADIGSWAIHPGGPKILTAAADSLGLSREVLRHSEKILANHGNMSSGTVLFVLNEIAEQVAAGQAAGPCVAIGFGPGLIAEGMLLEC